MADFKDSLDEFIRFESVKDVRDRNAVLPIGTLPTELLLSIFNLVLFTPQGQRPKSFVSTIIKLRAVSWSWRDLIGRTPSFWTHISPEDGSGFVSEALEMSDNTPLHIRHIGPYTDGRESQFLDKVLPHSHRWESVTIHRPNADAAARYFTVPAPTIKAILLSRLPGGVPQPGGLARFGGGLEYLEELRIAWCPGVDWGGLGCTQLRVLEIVGESPLDMDAVLNILAANPSLEVLRLHYVKFAPYARRESTLGPTTLHNLKELSLMDMRHLNEERHSGGDGATAHILQRIQFRPGIAFNMRTGLHTDFRSSLERHLSLIPSPVVALTRLSQIDGFQRADVYADLGDNTIGFKIEEGSRSSPVFSIEMLGLPEQVAYDWTMAALGEATKIPISLQLRFSYFESQFSLDQAFHFQLWESVNDLVLHGSLLTPPETGPKLLRLLSTPCMSEDGTMVMPFPRLQNLHLGWIWGINAEGILAMVRARFAPPGSTEDAIYSAVPAPLTIHCHRKVEGWTPRYTEEILATTGVERFEHAEKKPNGDRDVLLQLGTKSNDDWPPT
ncbi:hypothetical protein FS837_002432 [Tulasnella sp. UAMH 9824]|nr:hypothetical protein FS837_002432 [Tulasnella sp. UAMH 9824]